MKQTGNLTKEKTVGKPGWIILAVLLALLVVVLVTRQDSKGPLDEIGDAVEDVGDEIEDAAEDVQRDLNR